MSETPSPDFGDRISQFIEDNGGQRVVLGLLALLVIQGFFVIDWVIQRTAEREVSLLVVRSDVERMEALSKVQGLDDALQSYEQRLGSYRSRVFTADTAGLAAAQIRTTLQSSADAASLTNARMTVNVEDSEDSDIIKFVVDMDARETERGDFAYFLSDLARHPQVFYVSSLDYRVNNRALRLRLECGAEIGTEES